MKSHHIGVLILTLVFLMGGLLSYTLVQNGYFPVVAVDGNFISQRTVKENADVSRRLYSQGLVGSSKEMDDLFKKSSEKELMKNSLEGLIINQIVKSSASNDQIKKAEKEVEVTFDSKAEANLSGVLKNVYKWDADKFKERILEPQALLQVVSQEKGEDFDNWLKSAKLEAKVKVWFSAYKWENGELKAK
ncbi:MAG: SurA N-terminal domain-containing protein [bacterium]|nr:SurA N-terminal domain-containing protein [bacterium]